MSAVAAEDLGPIRAPRSGRPRWPRRALTLRGGTVIVLALASTTWLLWPFRSTSDAVASGAAISRFERDTGIRVVRVAVTAGGGLVDLRYLVIDAEAADTIHRSPPYLVEEGSGTVVDMLFMGHAHGGEPKTGYTYPLLFMNEGGSVERGGSVSVVVGDSILEHVVVQ